MSTPLSQPGSRLPRSSWKAVERARLTVVPGRPRQASRVPFVTLVTLLLLGGVIGLLLFNTSMQQSSFVATSLEERAAVLQGKEESLRMQLHRLRDPQHLAARAKKLGMVPASSPAFLRLEDGKVLGRPEAADPADALQITPAPRAKPQSLRPRLVIAEAPAAGESSGQSAGDTTSAGEAASRADGPQSRTNGQSEAAGARRSTGRAR